MEAVVPPAAKATGSDPWFPATAAAAAGVKLKIQQLLLWLLLHPRNQTANTASQLLLQHGIHQLHSERWCFIQNGLQLGDHIAAACKLGFLLCCENSRWCGLQELRRYRATKQRLQAATNLFGLFHAPCRPHAGSGLEQTIPYGADAAAAVTVVPSLVTACCFWPWYKTVAREK
jgi:hypothetical protein